MRMLWVEMETYDMEDGECVRCLIPDRGSFPANQTAINIAMNRCMNALISIRGHVPQDYRFLVYVMDVEKLDILDADERKIACEELGRAEWVVAEDLPQVPWGRDGA